MLANAHSKGSSSSRFAFRLAAGSALLLFAAAACGCGRPFNVNTQPTLPPASYAAKATVDSVAVEAQAITDEDFLYDNFDANLISAGVLPVRVMLTNSAGEAIDLKSARFEIEAHAGRFKAVNARKAFKRLISYYGISAYSKSGYNESLDAFAAYAFDVATPLAGGQSRQGLLFFLVPGEAAREAGLTMVIGKLSSKQPGGRTGVALKLN
jgi:hypothetical protein